MARDRTGEDVPDPESPVAPDPTAVCPRCRGTGFLSAPDADVAVLCSSCRDTSYRRRRPVREYFEPVPSENAMAAIERAEKREAAEREQSRGYIGRDHTSHSRDGAS